jgi:hypothetical protein
MSRRPFHPLNRRDAAALALFAQAAGFAAACDWETSQQWHEYAVARVRHPRRPFAMPLAPSPVALLLALVFVTL